MREFQYCPGSTSQWYASCRGQYAVNLDGRGDGRMKNLALAKRIRAKNVHGL